MIIWRIQQAILNMWWRNKLRKISRRISCILGHLLMQFDT
jgi:hypothetical protein